ncbi:MAG: tyrosine-type recombinase/integrase [Candidatus Binataceae bacterium]
MRRQVWGRFKYRFGGRENPLSLGADPDTSLKQARERRDAARKQIEAEIDPSAQRKIEKAKRGADTFEAVAREWYEEFSGSTWTPHHSATVIWRLERYVFPWIGGRPAGGIAPPELLALLRRIESRGALETAHRVSQICGMVFRYAVATGARSAILPAIYAARSCPRGRSITPPSPVPPTWARFSAQSKGTREHSR